VPTNSLASLLVSKHRADFIRTLIFDHRRHSALISPYNLYTTKIYTDLIRLIKRIIPKCNSAGHINANLLASERMRGLSNVYVTGLTKKKSLK